MSARDRSASFQRTVQRGFTLVELLVTMILTLLVVLAATAMLTTARQGFSAVDATSQLRDNARFATSIVQRIVDQAGYLDTTYAASSRSSEFQVANLLSNPEPPIRGYNDAQYRQPRVIGPTTENFTDGINDSDMLAVRFQPGTTFPGSAVSDGTMINCAGTSEAAVSGRRFDRMVNVFHVQISNTGEPALMCTSSSDMTGVGQTIPLVDGVETFQVLFGVDGVSPGAAPTAAPDTVVDRYLRADQLTVSGNADATYKNWQRVRSVRVGMVLRGPPGSAPQSSVPAQFALGPLLSSDADAGTRRPVQSDGRLRQTVNFTMYLRNAQNP